MITQNGFVAKNINAIVNFNYEMALYALINRENGECKTENRIRFNS